MRVLDVRYVSKYKVVHFYREAGTHTHYCGSMNMFKMRRLNNSLFSLFLILIQGSELAHKVMNKEGEEPRFGWEG